MKILVTGAGGFIGSFVVRRLLERGEQVRGLLLPGEPDRGLAALGMEIFRGDLTVPSSIRGVAEGCGKAIHAANRTMDWGTKRQFFSIGVDGTRNLLEECAGRVERFLFISSVAAYGLGVHMRDFDEDTPLVKTGVHYGDAKVEAERLVRTYRSRGALEATIVRPSNVTGPGSVWVWQVLDLMHQGPFPLIDKGVNSASLIYVENLVDGILLALESDRAAGRTYNLRDDYKVTWKEYLEGLSELVGKRLRGSLPFGLAWKLGRVCDAVFAPLNIRPPMTTLGVGVVGRNLDISNRRAKEELGWRTRVPWEEAWEAIKRWVREEYRPSRRRRAR